MINHARTLLLNAPGETAPRPDIYYDAYTPAYPALSGMPHGLQRARDLLFGSRPDYQGRCIRVAQCLGVVASTPYAEYLRALDARITHDFSRAVSVRLPAASAHDTGWRNLAVTGNWVPPADTGQSSYGWVIQWGGDGGIVKDWRGESTACALSTVVPLPGSSLLVTASALPVDGSTWRVGYVAQPTQSLVGAVSGILEDAAAMAELFPANAQEPVRTFYALAANHALFPYRAAGVVLGLIWRMEAYRGE